METLSLPMSNGELKIFVEYHSIQMLNRSFQKCVKFHTNLFWQLLMETLSLPMSNGELKIFVEYHSIQMLNIIFSEVCEISYKFILATSHGNTYTTNE